MAEKTLNNIRIVNKHDTEENWLKATGFTPKQGELIVYDIDDNYDYERIKIGDGVQNVNDLPFTDDALREYVDTAIETIPTPDVSGQIETHNASETAHSDIRTAINDVSALVGDKKVSEQIAAANIIHVGPDRPTDPNIKVWINTAEDGTGIVPVFPRIATITLPMANWGGSEAPHSQVVEINTVTAATKIDLQPTVAQIVALQNDDIALMAENISGVVTIYSFGGKPSSDMTMQVLLTEVSYV